jgi:hypothetical protein
MKCVLEPSSFKSCNLQELTATFFKDGIDDVKSNQIPDQPVEAANDKNV